MLLVLLTFVVAATTAADVVALDSSEALEAFIDAEPATIVKFYAPWCGHCRRMASAFAEAAAELDGQARLAEVDCTQHASVCSTYGVRGYPTLKVFTKGVREPTAYSGQRTADDFVAVVRAAIGVEATTGSVDEL